MRKTLAILVLAGVGLGLLFFLGSVGAQAQSASPDKNQVDSLVERIKAAKADVERRESEDENGKPLQLTKPDQRSAKEKAKETEAKKTEVSRKEEGRAANILADRYLREAGEIPRMGPRDILRRYEVGLTPEEILKRIRESRATEAEAQKKGQEKKPDEGGIAQESAPRDYRELAKEYSPDRVYLAQPRVTVGPIGAETLPGRKDMPSAGMTEIRRSTGPSEFPDPNKDLDRYQALLTDRFGVRGELPQFIDPSLRSTYEAQRFRNWLTNEQDVRVEPGRMDVSQLYSTYRAFQSLPEVNKSLGRRDAYVPNSTNYLTPAYRGSIYSQPFSSDPYARNYSPNSTQSKYSSPDYYSLNTRESFSDYYQREYGVSNAFVPGSAARQYEVNTVKQWADSLRQNYGIDVRPGERTYSEMYRLNTSMPRY